MFLFPFFILFILGLAVGSFLNVLIDRLPKDEQIIKGRSYCDHCRKLLGWYDMVPLLSFVLLKGKCRYCRAHISFYYPLVEFVTGTMFVLTFLYLSNLRLLNLEFGNYLGFRISNLGFILNYFYHLFILSSLIVIFFTDLKYGLIPDRILYPAILIALIFNFQFLASPTGGSAFNFLLSGLGAFIFFLFLYFITRGKGMGFGDVKLAFLMGLILGFPKIITALYLAFLTGAVVGLILVLGKKKKFKKDTVPFGPFLVFGTIIAFFWGDIILSKIWSLLRL